MSPARQRMAVLGLGIALVAVFLALVCVGRYSVSPAEAFRIMGAALLGQTEGMDPYQVSVVLHVRLPRIFMGILVGAGLAVAGTAYQGIFGNPLVSPDILGVS